MPCNYLCRNLNLVKRHLDNLLAYSSLQSTSQSSEQSSRLKDRLKSTLPTSTTVKKLETIDTSSSFGKSSNSIFLICSSWFILLSFKLDSFVTNYLGTRRIKFSSIPKLNCSVSKLLIPAKCAKSNRY